MVTDDMRAAFQAELIRNDNGMVDYKLCHSLLEAAVEGRKASDEFRQLFDHIANWAEAYLRVHPAPSQLS